MVLAAREYAPKVLGPLLNQVKEIRLVSYKRNITWAHGYLWLYKDGIATIKVPGIFRTYSQARWLVVHELAHLRQILSGQLKISPNGLSFTYQGSVFKTDKHWQKFRRSSGRLATRHSLPWENHANKIATTVLENGNLPTR